MPPAHAAAAAAGPSTPLKQTAGAGRTARGAEPALAPHHMPASPSDASLAELAWLGVHDRSVDETCDSEDAEGTVRLPAPAGGRTPLKNIWPRQTPQATPRGRPNAAAKGAAPAAATPASLLPRRTPSRRTSADSSDEEETWSDASSHSAGTIARHSRYASAMSTLRLAGARRRAEAAARAAAGEATILVGPAGVDVARWVRAGGAATQAAAPPSLPDTRRAKATSRDAEAGASRQPSLQQPLPSPAPARVASPPPAAPVARDEQPSPAQGLQDHGEQATSATTPHAPDHSAEDDVEAALAELDADMIATLLREVDGEGSADPAGKEAPDRAATSTYGGGMPDETVRSDLAIDAASPADALVAQYNADDTSQQLVGGSDVREGYSVSDVQVPAASPSRQSLGAADRDEPQPEPQPEARRVEDTSKASQLRAPAPGGRSARALYDFAGEATFNELSLKAGQCFEILVPELRGGWSLGRVMLPHEGGGLVERRGLVPLGWYCFIQDFAAAPGDSSEGAPSAEADDQLSVLRAPAARDSTAVPAYAKAMRPPDEDAKQRPASGVGEFHRKGAAPAIKTLEALHGSYDAADTRASLLSRHAASAPASDGLGSDLIDHRVPVSSSPLLSSPPTPTLVVDGAQDGSPDGASGSTAPPVAAPATGSSFLSASWRGAGLLGGRSFNRFSPFVVSGAEAFILSRSAPAPPGHARASAVRSAAPGQLDKSSAEASGSRRGARHVDADLPRISDSLHGPQWEPRAPPYHVVVHSPEPRWDANGAEYTVYAVTSLFGNADTDADSTTWRPYDPAAAPVNPDETLSVWRRFSHFHWLSMYIARALPLLSLSLPPPPAKVLAGRTRLEPDFVETRRRELGAWLTRVARHPVLRTEPGLVFFLGCADEHTWNARAPGLLAQAGKAGGYSFFAATCHDQWAFDASEADEAAQRLDEFNGAYERSMGGHRHGLLESFAAGREALAKTSGAYRAVGHGLLRLTTGFGGSHASGADASASAEDEAYFGPAMGGLGERGQSGATNEDGAWCWRPDCAECLAATRALQSTAHAFEHVAEAYTDHAHHTLLVQHERLRDISKPQAQNAGLMDVHRQVLSRHRQATGEDAALPDSRAPGAEAEALAARCETVLNVTMSEMDRAHNERVEDWISIGRSMLDDEIALYSEVLARLQAARACYEPGALASMSTRGPILPAVSAAALRDPPVRPLPLVVPDRAVLQPGVLSTAFRPVSLAGEVLGGLFGAGTASTERARASSLQRSHSANDAPVGGSVLGFWR